MVDRLGLAAACGKRVCADHDAHRSERPPARQRTGSGGRAIAAGARGLPRSHVELRAHEHGFDPAIDRAVAASSAQPRRIPAVSSSAREKTFDAKFLQRDVLRVPSVAMVVNKRKLVLPLRKCIGSTGAGRQFGRRGVDGRSHPLIGRAVFRKAPPSPACRPPRRRLPRCGRSSGPRPPSSRDAAAARPARPAHRPD